MRELRLRDIDSYKVMKPGSKRAGVCLTPKLIPDHYVAWRRGDLRGLRDPHFLTKEEDSSLLLVQFHLLKTQCHYMQGDHLFSFFRGQMISLYACCPSSIIKVPLLLSKDLPIKCYGHCIICQICCDYIIARIEAKKTNQKPNNKTLVVVGVNSLG